MLRFKTERKIEIILKLFFQKFALRMCRLNWLRIRPIVGLGDNRDKCLFFITTGNL